MDKEYQEDSDSKSNLIKVDTDTITLELEEGECEFNESSSSSDNKNLNNNLREHNFLVQNKSRSDRREDRGREDRGRVDRGRDRGRVRAVDIRNQNKRKLEVERDHRHWVPGNENSSSVILKSIIYSDDEGTIYDEKIIYSKYDKEKHERIVAIPGSELPITESSGIHLLFSQLASNNPQIRLTGFEKLKSVSVGVNWRDMQGTGNDHKMDTYTNGNKLGLSEFVFRVIVNEIEKIGGDDTIRKIAMEILILISPKMTSPEITRTIAILLGLSYNDPSPEIRCSVLKTLEVLIKRRFSGNGGGGSGDKNYNYNYLETEINRQVYDEDKNEYYNVLKKLPFGLTDSEVTFAIISYVAANDTHHTVRHSAMKFLSKIPGKIRLTILMQSVKKDQCKSSGSGSANALLLGIDKFDERRIDNQNQNNTLASSTKKGKKLKSITKSLSFNSNSSKHTIPILPLLCCGVFTHGIEDQFVKIRLEALISLFQLLKNNIKNNNLFSQREEEENIFLMFIEVFLDALLDECDLIRLGALKFINQMGELVLTLGNGLESLLAVLDDQNVDIRWEALKIIRDNLKINRDKDIFESLLRTQKCLEAALEKYPKTMELKGIEATYRWIVRSKNFIQTACPEFVAQLMQSSDPKFMLFGYEIPCDNQLALTLIQQVMQLPFMKNEIQRKVRMVRLISRTNDTSDFTFSLLSEASVLVKTCEKKEISSYSCWDQDDLGQNNVKLFKLLVSRAGDLKCHLKAQKMKPNPITKFNGTYFYAKESPKEIPCAFFRPEALKIKSGLMLVERFKVIGELGKIKLVLSIEGASGNLRIFFEKKLEIVNNDDKSDVDSDKNFNTDTSTCIIEEINNDSLASSRDDLNAKFRTIFVAKSPEIGPEMGPFKILNGISGQIIYSTARG